MRFRQVVADKKVVKLALGFFDLLLTTRSTYIRADASVRLDSLRIIAGPTTHVVQLLKLMLMP